MSFNYAKLRGKIVEMYGSQTKFAEAMGISDRMLSLRMNGKSGWKQADIVKACELLQLDASDITLYFFNIEVQY